MVSMLSAGFAFTSTVFSNSLGIVPSFGYAVTAIIEVDIDLSLLPLYTS